MHFTHFGLGNLDKGRIVEVHLQGNAANVYLLDQINYQRYSRGENFQAVGGLHKSSPIRLMTPKIANWHIAVDLPGGYGSVKTSYRVLNKSNVEADARLRDFTPSDAQKKAKPATLSSTPQAPNQPRQQTPVAKPSAGAPPTAPNAPAASPETTDDTQTVNCRKCGTNVKHAKFCPECGEPLEKTCPACFNVDKNNGKFCTECGTKLI